MITVYIGDVFEYLANQSKLHDPDASLITSDNFKNLTAGTYYTSIADLNGLTNLGSVLMQADRIVYAPPPDGKWSDVQHGVSKMQEWTEEYLQVFGICKQIENFSVPDILEKNTMLALADSRKTQDPQLWIAGCSISHGIGVTPDQRYGQLLSDQLKLPASFLTQGGASIIWAADQILRSDIRSGDLVIWGLTAVPRLPWFNHGELIHVIPRSYKKDPGLDRKLSLDYLTSDDVLYRSVIAVKQVINYCEKIGARLILANLLGHLNILNHVKGLPNLIQLGHLWGRDSNNFYIDFGNDSEHPGPETHKFYAQEILQMLNKNVIINYDIQPRS